MAETAQKELKVVAAADESNDKAEEVAEATIIDGAPDSDEKEATAEDAKNDDLAETADDAEEKKVDSEETDAEISKLERAIIRQLNYYFGDANLVRDKFLLEQIAKDEGGWVPITTLLTFKRLSDLSKDASVIIAALSKDDSGLIEISEDREKLRRHPECAVPEQNEERLKEVLSRTAYVKGFPLDATISEIIDYFVPFEKVVNISMRKYVDKPTKLYKFKGSIFVTFETTKQMHEFVDKEKVVYEDRELIRKWQEKYLEEKREENKAKKATKAPKVEEPKFQLPTGTVVYFTGGTEKVTRELLREAVKKVEGDWAIAYVDYNKGEPEGHIRFLEENIAAKFLEQLKDNKLHLDDDCALELRLLTADEETAFLEKAVAQMKNQRSTTNRRRGHGHGHGHGHGNNRKRRGSGNNDRDDKRQKED